MNNLENFNIQEGAEGVDNGAFERLREKMAQARGQIKRDKKQEASQVKKDDILFNVLIEFIKHFPSDHPIVKGIVSCLASNIPSLVILASISLNYKSIHKAIQTQVDQYSQKQNLTIKDPNLSKFDKLIDWLHNLVNILSNIKESDYRHVYSENKLAPSLRGLIVHTLTEFFNQIENQEISTEQIQDYTQQIIEKIESQAKTQKQLSDDTESN